VLHSNRVAISPTQRTISANFERKYPSKHSCRCEKTKPEVAWPKCDDDGENPHRPLATRAAFNHGCQIGLLLNKLPLPWAMSRRWFI